MSEREDLTSEYKRIALFLGKESLEQNKAGTRRLLEIIERLQELGFELVEIQKFQRDITMESAKRNFEDWLDKEKPFVTRRDEGNAPIKAILMEPAAVLVEKFFLAYARFDHLENEMLDYVKEKYPLGR